MKGKTPTKPSKRTMEPAAASYKVKISAVDIDD